MQSNKLGVLYVLIGGVSYGILSTIVKLAYNHGYSLGNVVHGQFAIGCIVLWGIVLISSKRNELKLLSKKDLGYFLLSGLPLGVTSTAYYACVQYVPASVAIVLLFQFLWMGTLITAIQERKVPA